MSSDTHDDGSTDDEQALRERVAELEATVAELTGDATPEVSRRGALKAGGLLASLTGAGAIGAASAQGTTNDDDTKWGSPNNRDDYYADVVDANLISTGAIDDVADWVCNSASEIETAIANASDGDQIAIGAGSFTVNNPLDVASEVKITGAGRQRTTLVKANDQPLIRLQDSRIVIEDLTGQGLGQGTGSSVGILAEHNDVTRTHLSRVGMRQMGSHGYHIRKGNLSRYEEIVAENNGGDGIHYDEPAGDNNVTVFTNPNCDGNGNDGFHQEAGYNLVVIGGYCAGNGRHGWYHNDNNLRAFGNGGEGNTGDLFYFDTGADECLTFAGVEEATATDVNENNHLITTSVFEVKFSGGARFNAGVVLDTANLKGEDSTGTNRELIYLDQSNGDTVRVGDQNVGMRPTTSSWIWTDVPNTTTADAMTADPESASEDGYVTVNIGGTDYQIPIYQA